MFICDAVLTKFCLYSQNNLNEILVLNKIRIKIKDGIEQLSYKSNFKLAIVFCISSKFTRNLALVLFKKHRNY
jgi:hypothetical protein